MNDIDGSCPIAMGWGVLSESACWLCRHNTIVPGQHTID